MPTEVIHQVGAGQTYTTLAAWEAAQQRDLTAATGDDTIAVAELADEIFTEDLQINGWTTDATNRVVLRSASGNHYDYVTKTGAWFKPSKNYGSDFYEIVTVKHIRIGDPVYSLPMYPRGVELLHDSCAITSLKQANSVDFVYRNCLLDFRAGASKDNVLNSSLYNCTAVGSHANGQILRGGHAENCIAFSAQASPIYNLFYSIATGGNNASSRATDDATCSFTGITTAEFADYANDDFRLASTSQLIGQGADLNTSFTTDFEGDVRGASWDIGFDQYVAAGTPASTGSLNTVLDDITLNASGTVSINAAANITLDNASLNATGAAPISGALNATLDTIQVAATGTVISAGSGALNVTLDDATLNASGAVAVVGVANYTLQGDSVFSVGELAISGALNKSLDDITLNASGTVISAGGGSLNVTLDDVTLAASGAVAVSGNANITLQNDTLSAVGAVSVSGGLNKTLDNALLTATGNTLPTITGTLNATLDAVSLTAAGLVAASVKPPKELTATGGTSLTASGGLQLTAISSQPILQAE